MDFSKLLPTLPEWLSIPLILIAVLVWLWPRVTGVIHEFQTSSREYAREKQRLELIKLRYEIEVIKKENGLSELEEVYIIPESEQAPSGALSKAELASMEVLGFWTRLGFGSGGSVLPIFMNLLLFDWSNLFTDFDVFVLAG